MKKLLVGVDFITAGIGFQTAGLVLDEQDHIIKNNAFNMCMRADDGCYASGLLNPNVTETDYIISREENHFYESDKRVSGNVNAVKFLLFLLRNASCQYDVHVYYEPVNTECARDSNCSPGNIALNKAIERLTHHHEPRLRVRNDLVNISDETSHHCSRCTYYKEVKKIFDCDSCGTKTDRDVNSAEYIALLSLLYEQHSKEISEAERRKWFVEKWQNIQSMPKPTPSTKYTSLPYLDGLGLDICISDIHTIVTGKPTARVIIEPPLIAL